MRFVLVCEGSSDAALVRHIERLLAQCGCSNPRGDSFHRGSRIAEKIQEAVKLSSDLDLLFVHRDANNAGAQARHLEIEKAVENALPTGGRWVAVVPVRMTEAWLLLDQAAIRRVVGKPDGRQPLDLPSPKRVERVPDPKDMLKRAMLAAVATTGRLAQLVESWNHYHLGGHFGAPPKQPWRLALMGNASSIFLNHLPGEVG